jgi:hypothetical protein
LKNLSHQEKENDDTNYSALKDVLGEIDEESDVFEVKFQTIRVTFKVYDILFDGKSCKLIIMKDVTYQFKLIEAENKVKRVKTLT